MFNWTPHIGRAAAAAGLIAGAVALLGADGSGAHATQRATPLIASARPAAAPTDPQQPDPQQPFAVGKIVVRFVDARRFVHFHGHRPEQRPLVTVIRYPATGAATRVDATGIEPARSAGPFPLVVFAHGFDSSPAVYARLLQAWARAGYVVAAPVFPLTNENAPGGADESDIVNQPADMSFVITRVLAAAAAGHGILAGLVDPDQVAVAGQSDGAATALATAYDARYLDPRVDAAVILSGAEIMPGAYFTGRNPPLLATQGTADRVNRPRYTYEFFRAAREPKFLLTLLGARHLGPYTTEQPQLGIVERVTVAFLDRYLKGMAAARRELWAAGDTPRVASLSNGP